MTMTTQSPDVLQEAALREALEAVLNTSGARGEYHSLKYAQAVAEAERLLSLSHQPTENENRTLEDQARAWRIAYEEVRAKGYQGLSDALSTLPQEAATDEGEAVTVPEGWQLVPVEITEAMLNATCCDESDDVEMRLTWKDLLYAAPKPPAPSTPTSQPPAAETRLAEALERIAGKNDLSGVPDDEIEAAARNALHECELIARDALEAAALTQPEPTAQQACPAPKPDDETYYTKGKDAAWFEALSDKDFAEQISHAAMDLNDTGLADDLDKWMPFQAMMSDAGSRIDRLLSAQQAAGEAEAVGYVNPNALEPLGDGYCAAVMLHPVAYEAATLALYATPQPTETQRIVAWLREEDGRRGDTKLFAWAARRIEAGEHLAGDKA